MDAETFVNAALLLLNIGVTFSGLLLPPSDYTFYEDGKEFVMDFRSGMLSLLLRSDEAAFKSIVKESPVQIFHDAARVSGFERAQLRLFDIFQKLNPIQKWVVKNITCRPR